MSRVPGSAVRRWNQVEREFLAAEETKLSVADDVNRFFADPRDGAGRNENSPDFSPSVGRDTDGRHAGSVA